MELQEVLQVVLSMGPLPIGDIVGGIAGAKVGGKLGRQIDKIGAKKPERKHA